jgi:hypothetical protein
MLAVTTYSRRDQSRRRDTVVRELAQRVGIDVPARKDLFPRSSRKRQMVGGVVLSLHQVDGLRRAQTSGALLVFTTDLPSDAAILGVAFVASDDKNHADTAVLRAVASLLPPAAPGSAPEFTPMPTLPTSRSAVREKPKKEQDDQGYHLDLHTLH